jgi:hypothetical protein
MPDHGGNRTYDLSILRPFDSHRGQTQKLARWGYTLRVTSQASYSPEYITPTQKNHYLLYIRLSSDIGLLEEMFSFACPKFVTPSAPSYDAAPGKYHRVKDHSRL